MTMTQPKSKSRPPICPLVPHHTIRNAQWADPVLAVAGQTEKTHHAHMQPLNRPMNADDGV
ncbi:hypothetical protein N7467_007365 [Penicillium canescens]|nr:hypothetical protein N7467_007365 [Penicillium canescens]